MFSLVQFSLWYRPPGKTVTRPASSSRSNSADTLSAGSPARVHSESTSAGSKPMQASNGSSVLAVDADDVVVLLLDANPLRRKAESSDRTSSADSASLAPDLISA